MWFIESSERIKNFTITFRPDLCKPLEYVSTAANTMHTENLYELQTEYAQNSKAIVVSGDCSEIIAADTGLTLTEIVNSVVFPQGV